MNIVVQSMRLLFLSAAIFVAQLAGASNLTKTPYDPATDLPKLSKDIGLAPEKVRLHLRGAYFKLHEWMPSAQIDDLHTCVFIATDDSLLLVHWDPDAQTYKQGIALRYTEITNAAMSIDGSKHQLQLATPSGYLAISLFLYKEGSRSDSTPVVGAYELLKEKKIPVVQSQGRIDVYMPRTTLIYR
jgi:hypothetical protein